jgi:hypothetical protein
MFLLTLAGCDGREENALDKLANGASTTSVGRDLKAEAQAVMEPLAPPPPGSPGGLPIDAKPVAENAVDPDSVQAAAQVVQIYYGLLEQRLFGDAQDLWRDDSAIGEEKDDRFAARFRGFLEIHANVGAPGKAETQEAATDDAMAETLVTVPVQVYGRLALDGKPWYELRQVTLRRVAPEAGKPHEDRRWHIVAIGPYVAARQTTAMMITPTDGMAPSR